MSIDFKFERDPENDQERDALFKAAGARGRGAQVMEAQEMLANFVEPIIPQILEQAATSALFYGTPRKYNFDENPSIPLDLFEENEEGLFDIWSSEIAGGLASNHVSGGDDYRFTTYSVESAVDMLKEYLRRSRLDAVEAAVKRLAGEILAKSEWQAWTPILSSLANASTNSLQHIIDATTTNLFQLDDVNNLITRASRINTSWLGGTPALRSRGITDLVVSPEIMGQVRSFVYQPMNTRAVPDTNESTAVPLPDRMREEIYRNAGLPSIFGKNLIEINEFGVGKVFTKLFDAEYTSGAVGFDSANDELVLGIDRNSEAFVKMEEVNERGSTFSLEVDDQYVSRQDKMGWYGSKREGFMVGDNKALYGIVV